MPRPFLTARWTNLCLISYPVPPELLLPRLPPGLELDLHEGRPFVSLVAFDFLDTCVGGICWPGYTNFAELNLRFYVRAGMQRGVVFIREFVPQRVICWMARTCYHEPYFPAPLSTRIDENDSRITVERTLTYAGRTHTMTVTGRKPSMEPEPTSIEHFFKEHSWGFGRDRRGRRIRYQVEHPLWAVYPIVSYHLQIDWSSVYGSEWRLLQDTKPYSVVFAAGSAIRVFPHGRR